jgi:sporulation protein YlmC with PRC-barrel domain
MSAPTLQGEPFAIGADVVCGGEVCGKLTQIVVDPVARRLTHVVVRLKGPGEPRLVPVELVSEVSDEVHLECTKAGLEALEPAVAVRFQVDRVPDTGYGPGELLSWPYYGIGSLEPLGLGAPVGASGLPLAVEDERLPRGEVGIERGDAVHSADGAVGRVHGIVIDPDDAHVTHLLLEEGHLWGKKQVAIPIARVTSFGDDGAHVNLTSHQIRELPAVELTTE